METGTIKTILLSAVLSAAGGVGTWAYSKLDALDQRVQAHGERIRAVEADDQSVKEWLDRVEKKIDRALEKR